MRAINSFMVRNRFHGKRIGITLTLVAVWFGSFSTALSAPPSSQAYCALRDPVAEIRSLYPEGTNHRSITHSIDTRTRKGVREYLGMDLHFNELGRHTLYVVLDKWEPLGIVHARSEQGKRGLVEIAWALDLNLRVVDFRFQRCRESEKSELVGEAFKNTLRGKSMSELRALLTPDGQTVVTGLPVSPRARRLAASVIRCAMKTQAVTTIAWGHDLVGERMKQQAASSFPKAQGVKPSDNPLSLTENGSLPLLKDSENRPQLKLMLALGDEGRSLGAVVHTLLPVRDGSISGIWSVGANGKIRAVEPFDSWPDEESKLLYEGLRGASLESLGDCMTACEMLAAEVLLLSRSAVRP